MFEFHLQDDNDEPDPTTEVLKPTAAVSSNVNTTSLSSNIDGQQLAQNFVPWFYKILNSFNMSPDNIPQTRQARMVLIVDATQSSPASVSFVCFYFQFYVSVLQLSAIVVYYRASKLNNRPASQKSTRSPCQTRPVCQIRPA